MTPAQLLEQATSVTALASGQLCTMTVLKKMTKRQLLVVKGHLTMALGYIEELLR